MKRIIILSRLAILSLSLLLLTVSCLSPWTLISEFSTEVVSITEEEGDCAYPEWQPSEAAKPKTKAASSIVAHMQAHGSVRFGWLMLPDYPPEKS